MASEHRIIYVSYGNFELYPEKYKDTIEHVISKGNTPAGMHISIMVKEILDFLKIQPGETGFDATLGYGGHTKAMMECLHGEGHMYATDVDPEESAKTRKRLAEQGFGEDILTVKLQNFCTIDEIAKEAGGFDFILADLGVSSMQIDNPKRGFSFRADGPLDLRLNQENTGDRRDHDQHMSHITSLVTVKILYLSHIIDHQLIYTDLLINTTDHHALTNGLICSSDKVAVQIYIQIIHALHTRQRNKCHQIVHIECMLRQFQTTFPQKLCPVNHRMHQQIMAGSQWLYIIPSEDFILRKCRTIPHHGLSLCSHFFIDIITDQKIQCLWSSDA